MAWWPFIAMAAEKLQAGKEAKDARRENRADIYRNLAASQGAPTFAYDAAKRQEQIRGQREAADSAAFTNFYQNMAQSLREDEQRKAQEEAERMRREREEMDAGMYRRETGDLTGLRGGGYSRNPYG